MYNLYFFDNSAEYMEERLLQGEPQSEEMGYFASDILVQAMSAEPASLPELFHFSHVASCSLFLLHSFNFDTLKKCLHTQPTRLYTHR